VNGPVVNRAVVNRAVVNGAVDTGAVVTGAVVNRAVVNRAVVLVSGGVLTKPLIASLIITPILDPDRVDRCRGTATAAGNWSAPPPRGVGAPSRARSTS